MSDTPKTDEVMGGLLPCSFLEEKLAEHAKRQERELAQRAEGAALHPALQGDWSPRRCLHLGEATEINQLCKLLNEMQGKRYIEPERFGGPEPR